MERSLVKNQAGPTASMSTATVWSRTLPVCLTATKTRTHHLQLSTSQPLNLNFFGLSSEDVFIGCPFFKWKCLFLCMPFMDSKTLLTTMFSKLMFRIFVVRWLFVFCPFFVLLMLIKGGVEKVKAIRCCCTVVVTPSSFSIIHPVASVLEMRCKEYLRLFYILVVFMCVYIYVYIHTHLHLITPFHAHWQKYPSHVWFCLFFSAVGFDSEYNCAGSSTWRQDVSKRTYQIKIDISNV